MKFNETKTSLPISVHYTIDNFLKTGEIVSCDIPDFLSEGFCLYASIIALEFREEDFSFLNSSSFYINTDRDKEIKDNLSKTKKFRGKSVSDEEFSSIIQNNFLIDARNCFFHGNFEVIQENGENFFLLTPTRPHNPTTVPFKIRFGDIYAQLKVRLEEMQKFVKEGKVENKGNYYFKLLANCYVEMALFFSKVKLRTFQTKDSIIKGSKLIAQQFLTYYDYVYNQNEVYPLLKSYPKKQQELNIYRNSTAHAHTTLLGKNIKFVDFDEKKGEVREVVTSVNENFEKILDISNILTIPAVDGAIEEIEQMKKEYPDQKDKLDALIQNLLEFKKILVARAEQYLDEDEDIDEDEDHKE